MRTMWAALMAAGLGVVAPPARGQDGGQPLTINAVRFFSPASGTTTIEVVCELGLGAVSSGATQAVHYRVAVSVRDSTGLELQHSDWSREVPLAVATARGASAVETFDFRAAPGRYRVVVQAIPETGATIERALDVSAYAARPPLSDLLVANAVRLVGADSGEVPAGVIERGGLVLRTAPVPRFSPNEASLSYYAEVYLWQGASQDGELRVGILGAGRRSMVQTAPRPVRFSPAGGVARGSLDLTGLPVGEYTLQLRLALGDSAVAAEAPFSMGAARVDTASVAGTGGRGQDRFADASEAGLDSMYAPLALLLEPAEQGVYGQLAVDGKRRFLREFWAKRDPTHGAGTNQAMVQFYRAVAYANDEFREHGAGQIPGWLTDRGRIFLRNGRWDEILQRPMASPRPYEVWKYSRGRFRWYVFLDQSGLGNFRLIGSNDRREPGLQNWQEMLSLSENYEDVARFIGLAGDQQ
jgi:GWxTD domain-containing protein